MEDTPCSNLTFCLCITKIEKDGTVSVENHFMDFYCTIWKPGQFFNGPPIASLHLPVLGQLLQDSLQHWTLSNSIYD